MKQTASYIVYFLLMVSCSSNKLKCGDLFLMYGKRPPGLEFIKCNKGKGQVKISSKYRVSGKQSFAVEKYLVEKYGLGKLKFTCCGWEPENGKMGKIESKDLQNINPNYSISVYMTGNAEKKSKSGIEKDRNKIEFFYVTVKILEI